MQNKVDLLLSTLDKAQLADFIRKECSQNKQLQERFVALGVGTLFHNVENADFCKRLIQMAWDKGDFDGALRLTNDGVSHDSEHEELVRDWKKWQYRIYQATGDVENLLRVARYFFFKGGEFGDREFYYESIYAVMKKLITPSEWPNYVETLISKGKENRALYHLRYIYTSEKMWNEYMKSIRNYPSIYEIDDAPDEVKSAFRDEIVKLYSACVREFFQHASDRNTYKEGVGHLRTLITYGGGTEAAEIVIEQKSRTPRRPALIEELSKL